jgi:hypothetical protein
VKDRVSNDIGTKEPLQDWANINWKLVKKRVLRETPYGKSTPLKGSTFQKLTENKDH